MKKIPTIARSAQLPPSTLILQTFNTARNSLLLNSSFRLQNLYDVTPNVVAIAVMIERMGCKIGFQVSFFIVVLIKKNYKICHIVR